MTTNEIAQYLGAITKNLEQKRLKDVFNLFAILLPNLQNWQLQERIDELENTYRTMLNYLSEGIQDPDRQKVEDTLLRSLYQVKDSVSLQLKHRWDSSYFYEQRRIYYYNKQEAPETLIASLEEIISKLDLLSLLEDDEKINKERIDFEKQKELIIQKIFYAVWLSGFWDSDTQKHWSAVIQNRLNPVVFSSLIITALTLNLLVLFDENKALLLLEAAENENEEIRQRALTGIVLFLRQYDKRLHLYPAINLRIKHLSEDPQFIRSICHIVLQFIQSRETEKITRHIMDELIPELIKCGPKFNDALKSEENTIYIDKNPEWQDIIHKAGLEDQFQELSEMQLEGADIMHSSFTHLKNFPFFNEMSHWFLPFSVPANYMENQELLAFSGILSQSKMMCNSDKYSLYFTLMQMPEKYRHLTMSQLSEEVEGSQELERTEIVSNLIRIRPETRQYIQDLYRFYKLFPRRSEFHDIFAAKPEFYQVPSIRQFVGDKENMQLIGEFYFNKNYFEEAADIFDFLQQTDVNNTVLYQKKGYCLQMRNNLPGALETYLKAELLDANNLWIIKKLAYCYRALKQPEKALEYYKKIEKANPDNLSTQLQIGHCYLELKDYGEALKYYFKVEFLE
ncbi:MAG: hypothetical protein LBN18_03365, partial [Dysgonamonadaceae bacterium]|nr:hypothetical protein [Dysgonamonadaceae bacterium]